MMMTLERERESVWLCVCARTRGISLHAPARLRRLLRKRQPGWKRAREGEIPFFNVMNLIPLRARRLAAVAPPLVLSLCVCAIRRCRVLCRSFCLVSCFLSLPCWAERVASPPAPPPHPPLHLSLPFTFNLPRTNLDLQPHYSLSHVIHRHPTPTLNLSIHPVPTQWSKQPTSSYSHPTPTPTPTLQTCEISLSSLPPPPTIYRPNRPSFQRRTSR